MSKWLVPLYKVMFEYHYNLVKYRDQIAEKYVQKLSGTE